MDSTAATLERFGQIDSCFADAGVPGRPAPIDTMTTAEWRRVMSVNHDGQFFAVRAVTGHMKSRGTGSIFFTSSVSMSDGLPGLLDSPAAPAKILPRVPLRRWGTSEDFEALDGGYTVF